MIFGSMAKSAMVQRLDAVQAAVHSFLKPLGFRKKGREHNRPTAGGLTHALNFQMGEFPIGERAVIPGFRESYYGKIAVNLGVFLPCVYEVEMARRAPEFVPEYKCTIRSRLGFLAFGDDEWFELDEDTAGLSRRIVELLDRFGLPFFDRFRTYDDVLKEVDTAGDLPFQNAHRAALEAALIAHHLGQEARCRAYFRRAIDTDHGGFQEYVRATALRLGREIDR